MYSTWLKDKFQDDTKDWTYFYVKKIDFERSFTRGFHQVAMLILGNQHEGDFWSLRIPSFEEFPTRPLTDGEPWRSVTTENVRPRQKSSKVRQKSMRHLMRWFTRPVFRISWLKLHLQKTQMGRESLFLYSFICYTVKPL